MWDIGDPHCTVPEYHLLWYPEDCRWRGSSDALLLEVNCGVATTSLQVLRLDLFQATPMAVAVPGLRQYHLIFPVCHLKFYLFSHNGSEAHLLMPNLMLINYICGGLFLHEIML